MVKLQVIKINILFWFMLYHFRLAPKLGQGWGNNLSYLKGGISLKKMCIQRAKKVVSDSPGPVDFAIGLVNSVFNLPDG